MGACTSGCAVDSARMPSALSLCEAVETQLRHLRGQKARAGRQPQNQQGTENSVSPERVQLEDESIWHYLEKDEVRALGIIVERWSKGKLDGVAARQMFQAQVLRGQSQQTVELQNASSAFLRAGLDGALAGMAMGSMVGAAGRQGDTSTPNANGSDGMYTGSSSSSSSVPPHAASNGETGVMPGGQPGHPNQGVFGALAGGIVGGLAAAVLVSALAGERTQNVFTAIDKIFLYSTYEDSFGMAMQELGIDGPRPLPGEVRGSFQQRAQGILEAASRQHATNASWLDLVMLCLCAEVIRHLKGPGAGESSDPRHRNGHLNPATSTRQPPQPSGGSCPSSFDPRQARAMPQDTYSIANDTRRVDVLFGMDWPQDALDQHGTRIIVGSGGRGADPAIAFRLDPDFLRDRVFVLLESLLGGSLGEDTRPAGLSQADMDAHCPVGIRELSSGDSCPICLEPSKVGEAVRRLPCKHEFHRTCCEAWLATADTCPTCRFQVPKA